MSSCCQHTVMTALESSATPSLHEGVTRLKGTTTALGLGARLGSAFFSTSSTLIHAEKLILPEVSHAATAALMQAALASNPLDDISRRRRRQRVHSRPRLHAAIAEPYVTMSRTGVPMRVRLNKMRKALCHSPPRVQAAPAAFRIALSGPGRC